VSGRSAAEPGEGAAHDSGPVIPEPAVPAVAL
jgi:hypothetical protein